MPTDPPIARALPAPAPTTVLLTRPAAQSGAFAATLGEVPVVISPLMRIERVDHDAARLAAAEGLVFTSIHAVPAAGAGRGRPAFVVGAATAGAARAAGFRVVACAPDLAGLAPMIAQAGMALIHPHGRHLAGDSGVPGVVVYDQVAQPLNEPARALLQAPGLVLLPLFSPRSARLLAEAVLDAGPVRAGLRPLAVSRAATSGWDEAGAGALPAAEAVARPDAQAMRDRIMALLSGNIPVRHGLNQAGSGG